MRRFQIYLTSQNKNKICWNLQLIKKKYNLLKYKIYSPILKDPYNKNKSSVYKSSPISLPINNFCWKKQLNNLINKYLNYNSSLIKLMKLCKIKTQINFLISLKILKIYLINIYTIKFLNMIHNWILYINNYKIIF